MHFSQLSTLLASLWPTYAWWCIAVPCVALLMIRYIIMTHFRITLHYVTLHTAATNKALWWFQSTTLHFIAFLKSSLHAMKCWSSLNAPLPSEHNGTQCYVLCTHWHKKLLCFLEFSRLKCTTRMDDGCMLRAGHHHRHCHCSCWLWWQSSSWYSFCSS